MFSSEKSFILELTPYYIELLLAVRVLAATSAWRCAGL